jgi:hypothetical protein
MWLSGYGNFKVFKLQMKIKLLMMMRILFISDGKTKYNT